MAFAGMSIGCAHASLTMRDGMLRCLHGAVFTYDAWLYSCSSCYGACMPCPVVAAACVVGRRSMGERVVKHGSMFTVIHRVRPCEALCGHVRSVFDRSYLLIADDLH